MLMSKHYDFQKVLFGEIVFDDDFDSIIRTPDTYICMYVYTYVLHTHTHTHTHTHRTLLQTSGREGWRERPLHRLLHRPLLGPGQAKQDTQGTNSEKCSLLATRYSLLCTLYWECNTEYRVASSEREIYIYTYVSNIHIHIYIYIYRQPKPSVLTLLYKSIDTFVQKCSLLATLSTCYSLLRLYMAMSRLCREVTCEVSCRVFFVFILQV